MSVHVIQNTRAAQAPPLAPSGSNWAFEMVFDGARSRAWAESTEELLDLLIPGYIDQDTNGRFAARAALAVPVRAQAQAAINATAGLATLDQNERAAVLHPGPDAPHLTQWTSSHPLIVLDAHYLPYTDIAPPVALGEGRLFWFKVADEDDFLVSLHTAGHINLARRDV